MRGKPKPLRKQINLYLIQKHPHFVQPPVSLIIRHNSTFIRDELQRLHRRPREDLDEEYLIYYLREISQTMYRVLEIQAKQGQQFPPEWDMHLWLQRILIDVVERSFSRIKVDR